MFVCNFLPILHHFLLPRITIFFFIYYLILSVTMQYSRIIATIQNRLDNLQFRVPFSDNGDEAIRKILFLPYFLFVLLNHATCKQLTGSQQGISA